MRKKLGIFFYDVWIRFGVLNNFSTKTTFCKVAYFLKRHLIDGRAGWSECDFDGLVWGAYCPSWPDFAVERFEFRWKGTATRRVEEWAESFFIRVVGFVLVGDVEGVGTGCVPAIARRYRPELSCGGELFQCGEVRLTEYRGFPQTGAAEAAAEFTGSAVTFGEYR